MERLRQRVREGGPGAGETLRQLRQEVEGNRRATERLYNAIEAGLPMDDSLRDRAHKLRARREALLAEIAGLQRSDLMPKKLLSPRYLDAFCRALRAKLLDEDSGFGRQYLRLLVQEIRVEGRTVVIRGSNAALAGVAFEKSEGSLDEVSSIGPKWLPGYTSNRQP